MHLQKPEKFADFFKVLHQHGPSSDDVSSKWPVIGQFSSIGSLGNDKDRWLCAEWLQSLATCSGNIMSRPALHLVCILLFIQFVLFGIFEEMQLIIESYFAYNQWLLSFIV